MWLGPALACFCNELQRDEHLCAEECWLADWPEHPAVTLQDYCLVEAAWHLAQRLAHRTGVSTCCCPPRSCLASNAEFAGDDSRCCCSCRSKSKGEAYSADMHLGLKDMKQLFVLEEWRNLPYLPPLVGKIIADAFQTRHGPWTRGDKFCFRLHHLLQPGHIQPECLQLLEGVFAQLLEAAREEGDMDPGTSWSLISKVALTGTDTMQMCWFSDL